MDSILELIRWVGNEGPHVVETVGIIASLIFTAWAFRRDEKVEQISNLLTLTGQHREIWTQLYAQPELERILAREVDLATNPVTKKELMFVTFLIFHLNATYQAMRAGVFTTQQALARDIRVFFHLPIPSTVWDNQKSMLETDFVDFVETARKQNDPTTNGSDDVRR